MASSPEPLCVVGTQEMEDVAGRNVALLHFEARQARWWQGKTGQLGRARQDSGETSRRLAPNTTDVPVICSVTLCAV